MKTRSLAFLVAVAVWGALGGPAALAGQAADGGEEAGELSAAWTPFAGGAVAVGAIPLPFAAGCAIERERDHDQPGIGVQVHAGLRSRGGWDFRARFSGVQDFRLDPSCARPIERRDMGTGVHRRKTYAEDMWGEGLRMIDLRAAYSPPGLRGLGVAAGAGVEVERATPFLLGGVDLRLGSGTQFVAGLDLLLLRARTVVADQEWFAGILMDSHVVSEDSAWKRSWLLRLGADFPIGRR